VLFARDFISNKMKKEMIFEEDPYDENPIVGIVIGLIVCSILWAIIGFVIVYIVTHN